MPLLRRSGDNLNYLSSTISPPRRSSMNIKHNSVDKISFNLLDPLVNNTLILDVPATSPRRKSATAIMSRDLIEPDPPPYTTTTRPESLPKYVQQSREFKKRRDSETSSDGYTSESDSINTSTLSLFECSNG